MDTAAAAIICILFIGIIIHQVRCLRKLLIPTKKSTAQIIFTVAGIIVIFGITYSYGKIFIHYILGILGATVFGFSLFKTGITSEGFSYNISFIGFIAPWHKIKKVNIDLKKNVVVSLSGHGFHELCFEKKDYEKLISVLKQYLPSAGALFELGSDLNKSDGR